MFEKVCYQQPFIKEVILRFDFPSEIPEIEKGLPPKVSETVLKMFPIYEPKKVQSHHVEFGGVEAKAKIIESNHYIFHGLEREKSLTILPASFVIQVKAYKSFELFLDEAKKTLHAFCDAFPDLRANRIGLRYINVLEIDKDHKNPLDWKKYINKKLLGTIDFHLKEKMSRAFQILEYNFDEDALKFQVGIANPDYPAKIKRRQFILDIDASSIGAYEYQEMIDKVSVGHGRIQELFEASITPATRAIMKEVKADAA